MHIFAVLSDMPLPFCVSATKVPKISAFFCNTVLAVLSFFIQLKFTIVFLWNTYFP